MSTSTNTGIMDGIVAPPSLVLPTLGASAPNSRLPTPPPVKRRNAHSVPVSPKGTKKKPLSPIASKAPLSPIVKSLYEHHKKRSPRANKKLAPCPVHSLSSMSQATLPNRFDREKCYEGKESLATMRGQFAGLMYDVRPPPIKGTPLFGSGARFDREKAYEGKEALSTMRGQYGPGLYSVPQASITGTPSFGSGARFDREKAYEGKENTAKMRGQFGPGLYDVSCSKTGSPLWKARGPPSAAFAPRYSELSSTQRSNSLRSSSSLPSLSRTGSFVCATPPMTNATNKPVPAPRTSLKSMPKLVPLSEESTHATPPSIVAPKAVQGDDSGSPREVEALELERSQSPCMA